MFRIIRVQFYMIFEWVVELFVVVKVWCMMLWCVVLLLLLLCCVLLLLLCATNKNITKDKI